MKIAIVGIGKLGRLLVSELVKDNHDIVAIDNDANVIEDIINAYDISGFVGNGASIKTLEDAGIKNYDILISCACSDEINILSCIVAKKLNVKQTIARINNPDYTSYINNFDDVLNIDLLINPDFKTAQEIIRTLSIPSALHVDLFASGRATLVETKIKKESLLNNESLYNSGKKLNARMLVVAVKRNDEVVIPKGDFKLLEGDLIYFVAASRDITNIFNQVSTEHNKIKSCMIIGCANIAYYLASSLLDSGIKVKIIDQDRARCQKFSELLPKASIIYANGTSKDILIQEGLESVDALVSLTGIDETNMIVSSYAKSLGIRKVVTKVNNYDYDLIFNSIGLDSIVTPRRLFANSVLMHVKGMIASGDSECTNLDRLLNNAIEASEFIIKENTNYTNTPIRNLKIKEGILIGTIIRQNKVIIPTGDDMLLFGDSVVIISTKTINSLKDILA